MVSEKGKVVDEGGKGKRKCSGGGDDDKTGQKQKNRGLPPFFENRAYGVGEDFSDDSRFDDDVPRCPSVASSVCFRATSKRKIRSPSAPYSQASDQPLAASLVRISQKQPSRDQADASDSDGFPPLRRSKRRKSIEGSGSQDRPFLEVSTCPDEPISTEAPAKRRELIGDSGSQDRPFLEVSTCPDEPSSTEAPAKDVESILQSIRDLFSTWEQTRTSLACCSSTIVNQSATEPSASDMHVLKQAVLAFTSFMDMDLSHASMANQEQKLDRLSADLRCALYHTNLLLPTDSKLILEAVTMEVNALLAKSKHLKAKREDLFKVVKERDKLNAQIESAKSALSDLSTEIMNEDLFLMSLEAQTRDIQAQINDCKMRLDAKKHNTLQEVERTKLLVACYTELIGSDLDGTVGEIKITDVRLRCEWIKLTNQMQSVVERLA